MKFGLEEKYFEMIKNVLDKIENIEQVLLFGSRAIGNCKHNSDIDLALKGKKVEHNTVLKVLNKLDDLPLVYKFDVVNYNTVSGELKEQIDKYGILI